MLNNGKMSNVGIALGGGAIRGAAHLGVLRALSKNDIHIDYIAGTSSGGIVAALLAFEMPIDEMIDFIKELNWFKISNFTIPKLGLLSNEDLGEQIVRVLGNVQIEDAKVPLCIVASDITSGEMIELKTGPVAQAIRASSAIPGLYRPVELHDHLLVDGMIVENVPISPLLRMGAKFTIAVDVGGDQVYPKPNGVIDVMVNAFEIALDLNKKQQLEKASFVISPDLREFSRTDPEHVSALIEKGERGTELIVKDLHKAIHKSMRKQRRFFNRLKAAWSAKDV